jgi:hypothetical protein
MLGTQIAVLAGALIASSLFASQAAAENPETMQSSGPERLGVLHAQVKMSPIRVTDPAAGIMHYS